MSTKTTWESQIADLRYSLNQYDFRQNDIDTIIANVKTPDDLTEMEFLLMEYWFKNNRRSASETLNGGFPQTAELRAQQETIVNKARGFSHTDYASEVYRSSDYEDTSISDDGDEIDEDSIHQEQENVENKEESDKRRQAFLADENAKIDLLIRYKQLLTDGIITQEEFDFKKKEVLGFGDDNSSNNAQTGADMVHAATREDSSGKTPEPSAMIRLKPEVPPSEKSPYEKDELAKWCPECGAPVSKTGSAYCGVCGCKIPIVSRRNVSLHDIVRNNPDKNNRPKWCPECGEPVPQTGSAYCGVCGARIK